MKLLLSDGWLFAKPNETPKPVTLPHTWNAEDGADGKNDYFRGACTYTRTLPALDFHEDERVLLAFYAVNQTAEVYVNGSLAGTHEGGYSAFELDITPFLQPGKEAQLKVIADNSVSDHVYPQSADFTFFGGIYRDVVLSVKHASRFDFASVGRGVKITPYQEDGYKVSCIPSVLNPDGCTILWEIRDGEGNVIASRETAVGETVFHIPSPHLWNGISDPYRYTLTATLQKGGRPSTPFPTPSASAPSPSTPTRASS